VRWEAREGGIDEVRTTEGQTVSLISSGGQSSPKPGWELLLTNEENGSFRWTLYGIRPKSKVSAQPSA
jgi:hypothetical protein